MELLKVVKCLVLTMLFVALFFAVVGVGLRLLFSLILSLWYVTVSAATITTWQVFFGGKILPDLI